MSQPEKSNHPLLCNQNPWENNDNLIWLGSSLSLHRNLEKFNFPAKLQSDKRKQIISLLSRGLLASEQLKKPQLFSAEDVSSIEKEFLVEHFLSLHSFHQAHTGEAFILDETGEFLAILNLRDHVFLEWLDVRENIENSWDRLVQIELNLSKTANFAFSPKFGFLTSDPMECGIAFIASVFLHLPALLHTRSLDDAVKKNKEDGIAQMGLQGDPNEIIGDIFVFQNNYTLGVNEEGILASLRMLATKLIVEEKGKRQFFKQGTELEVAEFKDLVSRAYAILMHSYQIEAVEALDALSLVKLGLDVGWLKGPTQATLNHLLFACRRAHLLCRYGQKISLEDLPHCRAEFIHKTLNGLELLI